MRILFSTVKVLTVGILSLFLLSAEAEDLPAETACQENIVCSSHNSYGGEFTGTVTSITYYASGCVKQYYCHYDDGFRRRYTY